MPAPARAVRPLALLGGAGAVLAVLLVGALHVAYPEVDPVRRTISEYALGAGKAVFDAGVIALAAGSLLVLAALVRAGRVRAGSAPSVLLVTFSVALAVVVAFEKTNWAVGPSTGGMIHRYASLLAFLSLPVAALLATRDRRGAAAFAARWLGVLSLLWFGWILGGFLLRPLTGVPWWQAVPLGLTERGLTLTEVGVVVGLAVWAVRPGRTAPAPADPDRLAPAVTGAG